MEILSHVTIYRMPGRYAGWPANYGIWSWDQEIVLGFTLGYLQPGAHFHPRAKDRPFTTQQARSTDCGATWAVAPMPCRTPGGRGLSADEHMHPDLQVGALLDDPAHAPQPCSAAIDFTHPDFALLCARSGLAAGARSWFYASSDRGHTWDGPHALPGFEQPGVAARTDYLVGGPGVCTLFLTAAKADGHEGRVFCARTEDGGHTFSFVSWVTPEPEGYTIMPSSVRLPGGRILTAVRCSAPRVGGPSPHCWIDLYASDDDGRSWRWLAQPVADTGRGGNPPALVLLQDGRLCITYGYRGRPFGVRSVVSSTGGAHWDPPRILRSDGGDHDIGYTCTVQRADGVLVTAYYYNDRPDGERYIAATLWTV